MIFKRAHLSKFTAISNDICVDKSLSTDARWCLWYLLTKQTDWIVRLSNIQDVSGWGRDKTQRAIRELIAARYVVKRQERGEGGQFDVNAYDVYEQSLPEAPSTENPSTVQPSTANKAPNKDLEVLKTEKIQNTERDISFDAEFAEFWAAYPKRPNNPRKKAMAAYRKARKNVSQKQLLTAVGLYAVYMAGENPKFVAMASTWLNEERWNCDYEKSAEVIQSYKDIRSSADMDDVNLTELVKLYPGHVGLYPEVQAAVKAQLRTGATLDQICEAAKKYAQYLKELRYDGREIAAPMIETWLKFKWREMDAYEFARVGPDRRLTVRPKRKVQA